MIRQYSEVSHHSEIKGLFVDPLTPDSAEGFESRRNDFANYRSDVTGTHGAFEKFKKRPFRFDPHRLSKEEWLDIGIHPKVAANIEKYLLRGGRFYSAKDFQKIYGMDKSQADFISNYLLLPEKSNPGSYQAEKKLPLIDVNLADSSEWESIKGIGPVLAGRIVRYRNKLGGFVSQEQLREVYGFNDSLWTLVKKKLNLKEVNIHKIPVNEADFSTLSRHPYIGYRLARNILAYRSQHGLIRDSLTLLNLHTMNEEQWRRLASYLRF